MRVLFIGNSHTYFHAMPWTFAEIVRYNGFETAVTMLAHGGKGLDYHVKEPEVQLNILHGSYDAVILQHTAHPMGNLEMMESAAVQLAQWIADSGATPILYMTWSAKRDGAAAQPFMSQVYRRLGRVLQCPVAPVGEVWWRYCLLSGEEELYASDGEHASPLGSLLAAYTIARTVTRSLGYAQDLLLQEKGLSVSDPSKIRQVYLATQKILREESGQ